MTNILVFHREHKKDGIFPEFFKSGLPPYQLSTYSPAKPHTAKTQTRHVNIFVRHTVDSVNTIHQHCTCTRKVTAHTRTHHPPSLYAHTHRLSYPPVAPLPVFISICAREVQSKVSGTYPGFAPTLLNLCTRGRKATTLHVRIMQIKGFSKYLSVEVKWQNCHQPDRNYCRDL